MYYALSEKLELNMPRLDSDLTTRLSVLLLFLSASW